MKRMRRWNFSFIAAAPFLKISVILLILSGHVCPLWCLPSCFQFQVVFSEGTRRTAFGTLATSFEPLSGRCRSVSLFFGDLSLSTLASHDKRLGGGQG
jgi:hypothetical protein